jgi:hypothetical protein
MEPGSADRRLDAVLAAIDAANAADPNLDHDGRPVELVYGERMSAELARLCPASSGYLRIARAASTSSGGSCPETPIPPVAPATSLGARSRGLDMRRA